MATVFKYYVGNTGPQTYKSKAGELPFRVQAIEYVGDNSENTIIRDVALNYQSGIAGSGGNIEGTITAGAYSTFRAVHFNAYNIAGDLL